MKPATWYRLEADRALVKAGRLANRRPPWTAVRAGLRLDRIDTLCVLADANLRAATVADRTPTADEAAAQWAQLLTPGAGQDPQTAACTPRGDHGTPVRVVAEGSAHSNGLQAVSEGYGVSDGLEDLICGLKAALRATEAERDQALADAAELRMELRAVQGVGPQTEEARQ